MSEEEAKTKWCPFARLAPGEMTDTGANLVGGSAGWNRIVSERGVTTPNAAKCFASDCMAWRTVSRGDERDYPRDYGPPVDGYCGLAGAPR